MKIILRAPCILLLGLFSFSAWSAGPVGTWVQGQARVVDGDTLAIGKQRIRLHGIDAPESSQSCYIDGVAWECGKASTWELSQRVGTRPVSCLVKDQDHYGRLIADCQVGGVSLNTQQVEGGWALAYEKYSKDYLAHQTRARAAKRGIWSSKWSSPEQFRREKNRKQNP
jgi:endonuclease YncB( thermonuclease family)